MPDDWKTEAQYRRYRRKQERKARKQSKRKSVRTISGGLPSLGKRR
jgi:hypothetical protein